jgi:hypothetical protein
MTGSTLSTLLLLAVTAALSPFSLIAFSLVLATGRGPRNGVAFIFGWIVTVMLIGVGVAWLGDATTVKPSTTAGKWTLSLELALGVVLIIVWFRRRYRANDPPPHQSEARATAPQPAWQRRLSKMGYGGAFVAGGLVQTWPVMIAAGLEIARLDLGAGASLTWMFAFAVATTGGLVVLEILAWRSPGSAAERLDRIRGYVDDHRDAVLNALYLVAGLWLFFRGLLGLV